MDTTKATADRIEAARIEAGMTRSELSAASGIARSTLYRKLDGFASWTIAEIDAVAHALGRSGSDLAVFAKAVA